MNEKDIRVVKVQITTHKRLLAEKILRDKRSLSDTIQDIIEDARKRKKRKSELYGIMGI